MILVMVEKGSRPRDPMVMASNLEVRSPHLEAAADLSSSPASGFLQMLKYLQTCSFEH